LNAVLQLARSLTAACFQRKEAWELASAGAGSSKKDTGSPKQGASRGGREKGTHAAGVSGTSSLPPVEDMHPSWAARVKQQEAIKVTAIALVCNCFIISFRLQLLYDIIYTATAS
jgi:hypothetical protein